MKIEVFEASCCKSNNIYEMVKSAADESGVDVDVLKISDVKEVVKRDVMRTPALMVDGKVVCAGRIPAYGEVLNWILEASKMNDDILEQVKQKYAQTINLKTGGCGAMDCCSEGAYTVSAISDSLYNAADIEDLPQNLLATSLGCGNPTALCTLYAGETVLDLGSGAGLDVLLSAKRVGPLGMAYGLDMTDEMLAEANANKAKSGLNNVEFLKGRIENIPLADASVDVVISNCVINLSVDKDKVFSEIYRVLRPNGRIAVSDIVTRGHMPEGVRNNLRAWAGCVAGALTRDEYVNKLMEAGFEDVEIEITTEYDLAGQHAWILPEATASDLEQINGSLVSGFVRAKKV